MYSFAYATLGAVELIGDLPDGHSGKVTDNEGIFLLGKWSRLVESVVSITPPVSQVTPVRELISIYPVGIILIMVKLEEGLKVFSGNHSAAMLPDLEGSAMSKQVAVSDPISYLVVVDTEQSCNFMLCKKPLLRLMPNFLALMIQAATVRLSLRAM
jgi:hypothetical protein